MSQTKASGSGEFVESEHPASEQARWLSMYEQMLKIRIFEEHVNQLYVSAKMPGLAHLYIGEEAVAVGVCAGLATGAAMSSKMRGSDQVTVCFFGDGALGQGVLYEVMNMASLWKLPVIYVCENNLYGEYTPCGETIAGEVLARARAFGVHAESVDGQDVQLVNATMKRLVERARRGEGPAFLECKTYRYYGHHVGDVNREYRTKEEEREWMTGHDPLHTLASRLTAHGLADESVFERIRADVQAEIDSGVQFALAAPYPEVSEVDEDVYA